MPFSAIVAATKCFTYGRASIKKKKKKFTFSIYVVEVLEYSNRSYFELLNDKRTWVHPLAQIHTHTDRFSLQYLALA